MMAKSCVTEKTAQRQEWIENGLLELMLIKKYEQITVTELCSYLELSRRSFYRYFRDLDDVLDSLLSHTFQSMGISDRALGIEELQKNFEFWIQHRALLDAMHNSGMIEKLFEYTLRYTEPMSIDEYMYSDELGMDLRREASLFAASGSVSLAIAWYTDGFQKSPEQMAKIAHRMLFSPILKQK